jgi:lysophospholipase L1-like esterase
MRYAAHDPWSAVFRAKDAAFSLQVFSMLCAIATVLGCNDASRAGDAAKAKVAAIGDSITFGDGGDGAYPAQLAKLLGSGYHVANFGVPGATVLAAGDLPYVKQPAYRAAQRFDPDVVVIVLGTNDTKAHNWAHRSKFTTDLAGLVDTFRGLPSEPQVLLALPPPVFRSDPLDIDGQRLQSLLPSIRAVGTQRDLLILDLYALFAGKESLLPDHIHPSAEGNALIAREALAALKQARAPRKHAL